MKNAPVASTFDFSALEAPANREERAALRREVDALNRSLYSEDGVDLPKALPVEIMDQAWEMVSQMHEFCRKQKFLADTVVPRPEELRWALDRLDYKLPADVQASDIRRIFLKRYEAVDADQSSYSKERFFPIIVASVWKAIDPNDEKRVFAEMICDAIVKNFPFPISSIETFVEYARQLRNKTYPGQEDFPEPLTRFFKSRTLASGREADVTLEQFKEVYEFAAKELKGAPSLEEMRDYLTASYRTYDPSEIAKTARQLGLKFSPPVSDNFDIAARELIRGYFEEARGAIDRNPSIAELTAAFVEAIPVAEGGPGWTEKYVTDRVYALKRWLTRNPGNGDVKEFDVTRARSVGKGDTYKTAPEVSSALKSKIQNILDGNRIPYGPELPEEEAVVVEPKITVPVKVEKPVVVKTKLPAGEAKEIEPPIKATTAPTKVEVAPIEAKEEAIAKVEEKTPLDPPKTNSVTQPTKSRMLPVSKPVSAEVPKIDLENLSPELKATFVGLRELRTALKAGNFEYKVSDSALSVLERVSPKVPLDSFRSLFAGLAVPMQRLFSFRSASDEFISSLDLQHICAVLELKVLNLHLQGASSIADANPTPWKPYEQPKADESTGLSDTSAVFKLGGKISAELEAHLARWQAEVKKLPTFEAWLILNAKKLTFTEYGSGPVNLLNEALWQAMQHQKIAQPLFPNSSLQDRALKVDNIVRLEPLRPMLWRKIGSFIEGELDKLIPLQQ